MTTSRRSFLYTAAAAATAQTLASTAIGQRLAGAAGQGQGGDELRIGLVGCGGRGSGAIAQALSTKGPTRLLAIADMFEERIDGCLDALGENEGFKDRLDVPKERRFVGADAFQGVMASGCDVVVIATPPHFRPAHFAAAIGAKKHVFFEKPVAVDSPGVRTVLAASEAADKLGLRVVCGLQRHHQNGYLATMQRIHEGAIGKIQFARCSWNQGYLWVREREPNWSDMEWQLRNWLYFTWLSGDHIVEQHVHNIDVVNWALQDHPVRARGMGGRQVRTDAKFGHIFDHHAVQFEYGNGAFGFSECRQIDGCLNDVSEHVYGTLGEAHMDGRFRITGQNEWKYTGANNDPYQAEHDALFAAIRGGTPLNEGRRVAEATLSAIMGRMATYTGKSVTWDEALNSEERWGPDRSEFGPLPVDPVPMPGQRRR
ncbi:MAG: Gfo/Idh/MocA family oxidoreductase [Planctomycetes bacterium]|nr:Gfo/Idh/MocA family oxidoreductase [Planctomycetota bacterium]